MTLWLDRYRVQVKWQRRLDWLVAALGLLALLISLGLLLGIVVNLVYAGAGRLNTDFLLSYPSKDANQAGILSAWVGSSLVMLCTTALAIPIGICTAIYLEEYAAKNWLATLIEINIFNLAGIPSVIYGLLGLSLFVYGLHLGHTILVAGLTLALMTLPLIILTTREALRMIPATLREAAYAIGCERWQVIYYYVLPQAWAGILTGVIVGLSRAIGEAAPLLAIGTYIYVAFLPPSPVQPQFPYINGQWLDEPFTVLPLQIYHWISHPQSGFHDNAAAAGLMLLGMTIVMNVLAIIIRARLQRRLNHD
jgi:phosphate transport system permease protein